MKNKYFENIELEHFDYFAKFPKRRRTSIINDKSYDIYDKRAHFAFIYDAGKLNSFIKVVNDKLYLAQSWSKAEENIARKLWEYISYREPADKINLALFKKIFCHGTYFSIEVFKEIITQCIRNMKIEKIIFKTMPYQFPVEQYREEIQNAVFICSGNDYTVAISCHENNICVAMWDHSLPY